MSSEQAARALSSEGKSVPKGLTPYKPGQSGNPGGKPKRYAELQALSQANFPLAVQRLGELIQSRDDEMAFRAIAFTLPRSLILSA